MDREPGRDPNEADSRRQRRPRQPLAIDHLSPQASTRTPFPKAIRRFTGSALGNGPAPYRATGCRPPVSGSGYAARAVEIGQHTQGLVDRQPTVLEPDR